MEEVGSSEEGKLFGGGRPVRGGRLVVHGGWEASQVGGQGLAIKAGLDA
jgi:hypothetical protein